MGGPDDNGYAHPVENVIVTFDLHEMAVVRIEDHGVVPVPRQNANYGPDDVGPLRTDLKPIEITQPEGPSFTVDGHAGPLAEVAVPGRVHPARGAGAAHGRLGGGRPRAADPAPRRRCRRWSCRTATRRRPTTARTPSTAASYNFGALVNSLTLGCDCLGEIHYFDAALVDQDGKPCTMKNAICMHEEDYGVLWRHMNMRTNETEVRRSRRLVDLLHLDDRQLRLRLLLVPLPGRHDPVRGQADRDPLHRRRAAGRDAHATASSSTRMGSTPRSTSTSSTSGSTSTSTARSTPSTR